MDNRQSRQVKKRVAAALMTLLTASLLLENRCFAQAGEYLSPVSVVAGPDGRMLYVAEATADKVAVLDVTFGQVTQTIAVAEHPVGLAISADGSRLYVTSATPEGTVQVIDLYTNTVADRITVGHTPVAVVPDGETLYVCNQFTNNVGVVSLSLSKQVATIAVPREPVAAALTSDGRFLYVTNHLPAGAADGDYTACVVSIIDTAVRKVVKNIELPDGSTNLRGIAISPDGKYAYVTHILARYRFPVTYLERGWVNTNAMTVIDVPEQKYVNTVLLDDPARGAANPCGIACTADGKRIVITHAGTHEISVVDREGLHSRLLPAPSARHFVSASTSTSGRRFSDPSYSAEDVPNDLTLMAGIRRRIKLTGNGPRSVALVGTRAYAAEYFSDSIAVVDLRDEERTQIGSIPLGQTMTLTRVRKGEMLFHDATRSFQTWHSCSSCHSDGARACALNWDLLNDGMLNPKNAKSLLLSHQTPPAMATGVRADAETAVRSGILYIQFANPFRGHAEAMNAYLKSLKPVPSPYLVEGRLSDAALRGRKLFDQAGCARCHGGPVYTDGLRHRVGTATEAEPRGRFDTPTLIEVWRTAPYLHDGRATTVRDVLTRFNENHKHGRTADLSEAEISDLVEYVLTR